MDSPIDQRVAVIIEDDDDIRNLLEAVLTQAGFDVVATANGPDGIEAVRKHDPIVVTLDVNMPGMDGFETARRLRAFSTTYIVMLTALSEEIDTLQGLDAGADDYINKPFRPRELRARIEAMLRRPRAVIGADGAILTPEGEAAPSAPVFEQQPAVAAVSAAPVAQAEPAAYVPQPEPVAYVAPAAAPPTGPPTAPVAPAPVYAAPAAAAQVVPVVDQVAPEAAALVPVAAPATSGGGWLEHNGLWLNIETRVVQVDTTEIDLTRSEFDLLAALMESTRRVRTKADLVLLLRGESYVTSHFISEADKRAIEVHMANLRKKLSDNTASPRWIETVRGVGYRLTATEGS